MASISLYFNNKIVEFMGALQQNLMRDAGRNADHVPGSQPSANTTLDRPVAFFVRTDSLSIQQCASHEQRGGTVLDKENVSLGFMPLRRAVGFPVNQQSAVIGKIRNLLHRKVMRIPSGIVAHFLLVLLE